MKFCMIRGCILRAKHLHTLRSYCITHYTEIVKKQEQQIDLLISLLDKISQNKRSSL